MFVVVAIHVAAVVVVVVVGMTSYTHTQVSILKMRTNCPWKVVTSDVKIASCKTISAAMGK